MAAVNDRFRVYLLYKPNLPNAIWVALQRIEWSWTASASKDAGGNWSVGEGAAYSPVPSGTGTRVVAASEFPIWTANVNQLTWQ